MQPKKLLFTLAVCLSAPAYAEEPESRGAVSRIEEVVVVGHPLASEGLVQPHAVLFGELLERRAVDNIGETVAGETGIHNGSFGVAVGRPVIHGLGGARVRMLEDRIDTMDVSVTSGDHAVTVDPLVADRVEIFKGSSTLLYGSGAIGGVVDTHTGRIPHQVPDRATGKLHVQGGDNGEGRNGSFRLDGGFGNFGWHLDGFARERNDYDIPGYAESSRLMAMEASQGHEDQHHEDEHHDEDEHQDEHQDAHSDEEEEHAYGTVPSSRMESYGGAVGFSFIGERGLFGVSVSQLDSEYGIPGHSHAHGHEDEHGHDADGHVDEDEHHDEDEHEGESGGHDEHGDEALPLLEMKQTRIDVEAALNEPLPGFTNANLRLGINDYEHSEGDATHGTTFSNEAWEARLELSHRDWAGWNGTFGAQYGDREFSAIGEEAFTPPVDTRSFGAFWVGERRFSGFQLEAGARYDRVKHQPVFGGSDSFSGLSASLGAIVPMGDIFQARLLADYSTRAPAGEELYTDGPHPATSSFEIGDRDLDEEKAVNLSAILDARGNRWSLHGCLYLTEFSNFVYQRATGEEERGLAVLLFSQADATFTGLDLEGTATVADWGHGHLNVSAFYDTVSAELDISGNDNLPRIPPHRAGLGLEFRWRSFDADIDYVRAFKQSDVADFELATNAYDDLRAYVGWAGEWSNTALTVFLQGRNLTDDEQRLHASIVKDLVPQPGRTIEAGFRLAF